MIKEIIKIIESGDWIICMIIDFYKIFVGKIRTEIMLDNYEYKYVDNCVCVHGCDGYVYVYNGISWENKIIIIHQISET